MAPHRLTLFPLASCSAKTAPRLVVARELIPSPNDVLQGFRLDGTPKGAIQPDGSYLAARPVGSEAPTTSAVVFTTDVFGLPLVNCKVGLCLQAYVLDLSFSIDNGRRTGEGARR